MGAIYGSYGGMTADDEEDAEPSPRNDHERIDWILQRLNKPVDTPAVSPWGDQPEDFDRLEKPSRIDAQAMAPIYVQTGFAPDGSARSMADWMTQAIASLPRDPAAKIRVFARSRFPDLSPDEALGRYGVMGDRIFYIDRDGSAKWEEPSTGISAAISSPMQYAGSLAGSSMAMAGAGVGGARAGIGGAIVGAGAADVARQFLAERLANEKMSNGQRVFDAAMEAGAGGLGRYLGNFVGMTRLPISNELAAAAGQYLARRAINKAIFKGSRWIQDSTDERRRSNRNPSDEAPSVP